MFHNKIVLISPKCFYSSHLTANLSTTFFKHSFLQQPLIKSSRCKVLCSHSGRVRLLLWGDTEKSTLHLCLLTLQNFSPTPSSMFPTTCLSRSLGETANNYYYLITMTFLFIYHSKKKKNQVSYMNKRRNLYVKGRIGKVKIEHCS